MNKLTVPGAVLRGVVSAACKFSSTGGFGGADLLHLEVKGGKLIAAMSTAVFSRVRVDCEGELNLIGIDRRVLESFVSIGGNKKISIAVDGAKLVLSSRSREAEIPVAEGVKYNAPVLKGLPAIKLSKNLAARIAYLAEIAFGDSSRPELCCVLLDGKEAMSCNQRTVAVMDTASSHEKIAVPLLLAKQAQEGDILYPGAKETTLRSGPATYTMSTPAKAQKDYPLAAVHMLGKQTKQPSITVDGEKLSAAIADCSACLSVLARTETVAHLAVVNGKLELTASNGGAKFRAMIPAASQSESEDTFTAPLDGFMSVLPFLEGPVGLAIGEHQDTFLVLKSGWVLFPAWNAGKKRK